MFGFLMRLFGRRLLPELTEEEIASYNLKAGGYYSVFAGDKKTSAFKIVKMLVFEDQVAHIRVYRNLFPERPTSIDPDELVLGMSEDELQDAVSEQSEAQLSEFGIGHLPIHVQGFIYGWQPEYLMESPVTKDELMGYDYWKADGGGVF